MNEHEHQVETTNHLIRISYCECGQEQRNGHWREPRTNHGQELRKLWQTGGGR